MIYDIYSENDAHMKNNLNICIDSIQFMIILDNKETWN